MLINQLSLLIESGTCVFASAAVLRRIWISREESAQRYLSSFHLDPNNHRRFAQKLYTPDLSLFAFPEHPWVTPEFDLSPPTTHKEFSAAKAAVLDSIAATYLNWHWADHGTRVASEILKQLPGLPPELMQFENAFVHGLQALSNFSQSVEAAIQHALPSALGTWFDHSGIMQLVHAIEAKAGLIDSGNLLEFHPDGGAIDFDISLHFPWFTCVLSSV